MDNIETIMSLVWSNGKGVTKTRSSAAQIGTEGLWPDVRFPADQDFARYT